ncbi:hypothetical protein PTTW11_03641 [Pyrenophora teres f. teres]|uniref:Uncharacterized protein n=1 Tax=Pyrenophora teres f. teres TaxID=97479 RepID=A0A6S6VTK5_9PLEO|nr:hypothetical protein PTTW11_03641 [Pyrenophora teres f. teres]
MAFPASEALHQHIFSAIDPMRGPLPPHVVKLKSYFTDNIAFLVKRAGGPSVSASQVSVSIIDVRGVNNCEIGHKATVCIHQGPYEFRVVVTVQVPWGHPVMIGLTEKVDSIIKEILEPRPKSGMMDTMSVGA